MGNRRCHTVWTIVVVTALLMLARNGVTHAQKWGRVTDEEWAMTPPVEYPDADAIVVFDIGKSIVALGEVEFERHVRIKIFDKSNAAEALTVEIPHLQNNKIQSIRAHTLYPDDRKQKVEKKDIHRKKAGGLTVVTFAFPAVEDGAILEYSYRVIYNKALVPPPWIFQNKLFTRHSRFTLSLFPGFDFKWRIQNVPTESTKPEKIEKATLTEYTWDVRDIPPLKSEPLSGWRNNFLPSVSFRLTAINTWQKKFNVLSSAEQLTALIREITRQYIVDDSALVADVADSLCAGLDVTDRKVERIYEFVRDNIETRPAGSVHTLAFLHETVGQLLEKKFGMASEKNILLAALLRTQGILAQPLLIGTRDHAAVDWTDCHSWNVNHVLCHVPDDPEGYALDAGCRLTPFPYLPPYDLVESGLLIYDEDLLYYALKPPNRKSGREIEALIALDETGAAVCSTRIAVSGYEIDEYREMLADPDKSSLIREIIVQDPDLEFEICEANAYFDTAADTMQVNLLLTFPHFATPAGGILLFGTSPFLPRSNPFTADQRMFPVDFQYPYQKTYRTVITLPEGIRVVQLPAGWMQEMAGVNYSRNILEEPNALDITASISVTTPRIPPGDYLELKDIFDTMIRDAAEKIAVEIGQNATAPR